MIDLSPELATILMFVGILAGLALGTPVAFILGGLATIFGFIGWSPQAWYLFMGRTFDSCTNQILVAIPMFILMASFLGRSGISEGLFRSMMFLFGPINGAVGLAVIIMCAIEAACTGIIGASVVSMTILAMPVMLKYGYQKDLSTGCIAAGGVLSILIPPSIMLVMMADQAGVSVGKLFAGAFVPGLILTALFFFYVMIRTFINPSLGPALPKGREGVDLCCSEAQDAGREYGASTCAHVGGAGLDMAWCGDGHRGIWGRSLSGPGPHDTLREIYMESFC
jgi:TRAP-type mannitol/chloroaromatic compound transport system permease large subunit